jgi:hypothetical protein
VKNDNRSSFLCLLQIHTAGIPLLGPLSFDRLSSSSKQWRLEKTRRGKNGRMGRKSDGVFPLKKVPEKPELEIGFHARCPTSYDRRRINFPGTHFRAQGAKPAKVCIPPYYLQIVLLSVNNQYSSGFCERLEVIHRV